MTAATALEVGDIHAEMEELGRRARAAVHTLAQATTEQKNTALREAAKALRDRTADLFEANALDMAAAEARRIAPSLLDRLKLDAGRIEAMASGLEQIADLPDPVGEVLAEWERPNGLRISRVRVPLGVIGIIYESRPNVTADAGGLCLKSGNAAILRGGSESFHSSGAIRDCLQRGLKAAGLPEGAIQLVPTTDRAAVGEMLTMTDYIDIIVPRGGKSLIERVQNESRIPVIAHLEGLCHTYIDGDSDADMAREIVLNAKMRRPGICGATETLLIDKAVAAERLPAIIDVLDAAGCELRGDDATQAVDARVRPATEEDWR
ncbi:MAG: glutamate-5-semialdehyde dehydrogenase, partial [Alphaproteobacteria bacterium]